MNVKQIGNFKIIKDGTQHYKVIPKGKRKPVGRFLLLSEAEKFITEFLMK